MCMHRDVFYTDYGSCVCKQCGFEVRVGFTTSDQYTTNCPLLVGYSRNTRVKTILDQLFQPFLYGNPCHEIVYLIKSNKLRFDSGNSLHEWLNNQNVKNKKYTCCHYYFAIANRCYSVPPPPSLKQYRLILREFHYLETRFNATDYKSFFSYNWLLVKLLTNCKLEHYVQFIKPIKCTGRRRMYLKMYNNLARNSCTRVIEMGHVLSSQQQPSSLQDYARESLRRLSLSVSCPSTKNLQSKRRGPA